MLPKTLGKIGCLKPQVSIITLASPEILGVVRGVIVEVPKSGKFILDLLPLIRQQKDRIHQILGERFPLDIEIKR